MVMLIVTRFHGASHSRGAAISGRTVDVVATRTVRSYDYSLSVGDNHLAVVRALLVLIGLDHLTAREVAWDGRDRYFIVEGEN